MSHKILIVDDSLTVRMDLAEALTAAGFEPLHSASLAAARALLAEKRPRAIILDVVLPDGDGVDLLREIRTQPGSENTIVLMLSSEADVGDRTRGMKMGANEYVGKPYDTGYVVARLAELTGVAAPRAERPAILVVDDSVTYREALREAIERAGYQVMAAETGEEALRLLAARRVDAALIDGVLPGIDGATVIRRVRLDPALRTIPCALMTADDDNQAELRALDAGADAFVRKGDDHDTLLAKLAVMLRQTTARSQAPQSKRILLVDDDPATSETCRIELHSEGWDVICARTGDAAIELLALQKIDCIMLALPIADDETLCAQIKAAVIFAEIPLMVLCAGDERTMMLRALAAGADDHLPKPAEPAVLKARTRAQLRRKELEAEHRAVREEHLRSEMEARDAQAARELATARGVLIDELEAFSYSVSHDLRAPLRAIKGFSQALDEDHRALLPAEGQDLLDRVRAAAKRMDELIDDMLQLARVASADLHSETLDVSALARSVVNTLARHEPTRQVSVTIESGMQSDADERMVRILFENLFGNAWKFTSKVTHPKIHFGTCEYEGERMYAVKDNGAGFDDRFAHKLFRPFQRLHGTNEFPGTGVGLATAQRVVNRHGGRIFAESQLGEGATFYFTLSKRRGAR